MFLLADFLQDIVNIAEYVLMGAAALLGSFASHNVVRGSYRVMKKNYTWRPALLSRTGGALGGALFVYLVFGGFGYGPGFGPGPGGLPGGGEGGLAQNATSANRGTEPAGTKPEEPKVVEGQTLRIVLLGDRTDPRFQPPDRLFAITDDPAPAEARNVDGVIRRAQDLKDKGTLKEVELVLARDPDRKDSSLSTTLENAAAQVAELRKRVTEDVRVPFRQPDPDNPFTLTIRYDVPPPRNSP